jgi:hypothetical protein
LPSVRDRARDRLVFEAADAIDLGFVEPVEQQAKSESVSPGKPTMKVERSVSRAFSRQRA